MYHIICSFYTRISKIVQQKRGCFLILQVPCFPPNSSRISILLEETKTTESVSSPLLYCSYTQEKQNEQRQVIYENRSFYKLIIKVGKVGSLFLGGRVVFTFWCSLKFKKKVRVHLPLYTFYLDSPTVYILLPLLNHSFCVYCYFI